MSIKSTNRNYINQRYIFSLFKHYCIDNWLVMKKVNFWYTLSKSNQVIHNVSTGAFLLFVLQYKILISTSTSIDFFHIQLPLDISQLIILLHIIKADRFFLNKYLISTKARNVRVMEVFDKIILFVLGSLPQKSWCYKMNENKQVL